MLSHIGDDNGHKDDDDYDDVDTVWYRQVGSSWGSTPICFGHMWGRLWVVPIVGYDTVACIGTQLQQIDRWMYRQMRQIDRCIDR